jgi:hypothetical protein
MVDFDIVSLAFDVLETADVIEIFDHDVFIKVDRETWEAFLAANP